MPFEGWDVVVTGGTGALGAAVVGALVQAGAACTVPWLHENEAERFPYRENKRVKLVGPVDLADEEARQPAVRRRSGALGIDSHRRRLRHEPRRQDGQGGS